MEKYTNENNQVLSSTTKTSKCEQLIWMWRCKTNWGKPTKPEKTQMFPWNMKLTLFSDAKENIRANPDYFLLFPSVLFIHNSCTQCCPLLCLLLWEKPTNNIPSYGCGSKYKEACLQGVNSQIIKVGKYAWPTNSSPLFVPFMETFDSCALNEPVLNA